MYNNIKIIADLSYTVKADMPSFPGDGDVKLCRQCEYEQDGYRLSRFEAPLHAGTHIDMPSHLTADQRTVSEFQPQYFAAPGVLFDCAGQREIGYRKEYADFVRPCDALLIHTGFADLYSDSERYYTDFPVLSSELTDFICNSGITILGLDTPSPDRMPYTLHKRLLKRGIFIVENLTNLTALTGLKPHSFTFMALPLKLDAEASPVRAVAVALN